jgi:UDP-glucose 4-epimerase
MKAIVTGGAGFIGSHLVDALVARGDEVLVVDNLWTGKELELCSAKTSAEKRALRAEIGKRAGIKRKNLNPGARLFKFDIQNPNIRTSFNGWNEVDYIFHLAALPRVEFSFHQPILTNDVNINGTLNIIALAVLVNARRLIFSSSSSVYGGNLFLPLREDMPVNPLSPYALQKYAGEQYCRMLCQPEKQNRLNGAVCLRYFNVYGPRQPLDDAYSVAIPIFLENKKTGTTSTIFGDGEQTRDFTWVKDVIRANILAAESDKVGDGEVINIGSGQNYSINQLAEMIGGDYKYAPARAGDPRNTLADITKAKKLLDWEPSVSLPTGIAQLKI